MKKRLKRSCHTTLLCGFLAAAYAPLALAQQVTPPVPVLTCNEVPFPTSVDPKPFSDLANPVTSIDSPDSRLVPPYWFAPSEGIYAGTGTLPNSDPATAVQNAPATLLQDTPPDRDPSNGDTYWNLYGSAGLYYNDGTDQNSPWWGKKYIGYSGNQLAAATTGMQTKPESRDAQPGDIMPFQFRLELAPEVDLSTLKLNRLVGVSTTDYIARVYVNGQAITPAELLLSHGPNGTPGEVEQDIVLTGGNRTAPVWRTGFNTIEVAVLYQAFVKSKIAPPIDPIRGNVSGFNLNGIELAGECPIAVTHTVPPVLTTGDTGTFAGTIPAGGRIPTGTPVTIEILDAQDKVVDSVSTVVQPDGSYSIPHPVGLPAGNYRSRPTFGTTAPALYVGKAVPFQVLSNLPASVALTGSAPSVPQGDTVTYAGTTDQLPPGSPITVDLIDSQGVVVQALGTVTTDANGAFTVSAAISAAPGNYQVRAQASNAGNVLVSNLIALTVTDASTPPPLPPSPQNATAVPALHPAALAVLALLAAAIGLPALRRRNPQR